MSDIRLSRLTAGKAAELQGDASDLEKPLQALVEANLEALLGIRFLASEYSIGKTHGGRIDSVGIDENDCPVIWSSRSVQGLTSRRSSRCCRWPMQVGHQEHKFGCALVRATLKSVRSAHIGRQVLGGSGRSSHGCSLQNAGAAGTGLNRR